MQIIRTSARRSQGRLTKEIIVIGNTHITYCIS